MDKDTTIRTTLVIVLTLGVVLVWTYLFPPPAPEPQPAVEPGAASVQQPAPEPAEGEEPRALEALPGESASGPADAATTPELAETVAGEEGQPPVELVTETQAVTISARGGRAVSWKLLKYSRDPADPESGPIDLVSPEQRILDRHPLILETGDEELTRRVNDAWYVVERDLPDPSELAERDLPEGTQRVTMRWADGTGLAVQKALYLAPGDEYLTRFEWSLTQGGRPVPGASVAWGPGVARASGDSSMYTRGKAGGVIARGDEKERFDAGDLEGGTRFVPASANPSWIGIDGRYFAVAMVKAAGSGHASLRAVEVPQAEDGDDTEPRRIVMESGARELLLFTGPKEDRLLRELDQRLQTRLSGLVDWGFFGFISRPLYLGIAWIHEKVGNWGLAIMIMTILIRLAFIPLTQRSMISMRKTQENMAKLQPKIRKIKEKYRDKRDMESRRKMNEETMALYQKEGVNPMSSLAGCFPLLLQLPVLYGMFRMLTVVVELRGAPFFGWIVDLSAPDPYFITPIIMGVTMFAQQLMTMAKTEDPQQRSQQRIMLFMPLMFTYFFLWAPSGLVVYWLVNNILGIGQQYFVNRHTKRAAAASA